MDPFIIFVIVILILSVVMHEVSHGYAAQMLGDPTARLAGRLTLNPVKHIDPLGSVIIPAILVLTGSSFLIGWAKPVPYNPFNLRNAKWGEAIVAGAGPATNLLIAFVFGMLVRFGSFSPDFMQLAGYVVFINILLAFFNLIPIPPLDGSKVLKALLPYNLAYKYEGLMQNIMQYGFVATFFFLFIFISVLWRPFIVLVTSLFSIITGAPICEITPMMCG
jgi:Zn-dependent protease